MKHPSSIATLGNSVVDQAAASRAAELAYKYMWQVRDTCARAERAEFLLAVLAACVGHRFAAIHTLLMPAPVEDEYGVARDATDQQKAARHDQIRNLFLS